MTATETSPEATTAVEVVERREPTNDEQAAAIRAVTDAALETPGIPGREEFLNLCMQARLLSMSAALPKGVRGNPPLCLHIVLLARDYGISPASAPKLLDYIPEDRDHPEAGGDLSLSPEFMCFRVEQLGLGHIELLRKAEPGYACAIALKPDGFIERDEDTGEPLRIVGEIGRAEFSWDDARVAGLVDDRCEDPMHHWKVGAGKDRNQRCECRQGYRTYPKRMMGWRAKGWAAHDFFPSVSLGMYSAEELGADVDENGRPVDLDNLELPSGFDGSFTGPEAAAAGPTPASDEDRAAIRAAIASLDAEHQAALKQQWTAARIWGVDNPNFDDGCVRRVKALLRAQGWREPGPETVSTASRDAEDPETGKHPSEVQNGPETAQEPVERASEQPRPFVGGGAPAAEPSGPTSTTPASTAEPATPGPGEQPPFVATPAPPPPGSGASEAGRGAATPGPTTRPATTGRTGPRGGPSLEDGTPLPIDDGAPADEFEVGDSEGPTGIAAGMFASGPSDVAPAGAVLVPPEPYMPPRPTGDNGHRDHLDEVYVTQGSGALGAGLEYFNVTELLDALSERGDPAGDDFSAPREELADRLFKLIMANNHSAAPARDPEGDQPEAVAVTVGQEQPTLLTVESGGVELLSEHPATPAGVEAQAAEPPAPTADPAPTPEVLPASGSRSDPMVSQAESRLLAIQFEIAEGVEFPPDNGHRHTADSLLIRHGVAKLTENVQAQPQKAVGPQLTKRAARIAADETGHVGRKELASNRLLLEWVVLRNYLNDRAEGK